MGSSLGKGGGNDSVDPAVILDQTRTEQRMQNPNFVNPFGSSNTVFGADDQATVTQQFSPDMQATYDRMNAYNSAPPTFQPTANPYNQQMQNRFENNMANRSGFQMPERSIPPPMQNPLSQMQLPTTGGQGSQPNDPMQAIRDNPLGYSMGGEGGGGSGGAGWGGGVNGLQGIGAGNSSGGSFGAGRDFGGGNNSMGFGGRNHTNNSDSDEDGESRGYGGMIRDGLIGLAAGGPMGGVMGALRNRLRRRRRLREEEEEAPKPGSN